jgi:hypothetical protein
MVALLVSTNEGAANYRLSLADGGELLAMSQAASATGVVAVTASAPITSSGGPIPNIAITAATDLAAGSMSAADKTKLDGLSATPVNSVTGVAPIASSGGQTPAISIAAATDAAAGSMSAADKTKLDGITPGAAVSAVTGVAPIASSGGTAPAISISAATDATPGSMSAADKTKLDSITAGAAVASVGVTAPVTNTGTSTAPVIALAPTATPLIGNVVNIDNQASPTVFNGMVAAAWVFTPLSTGLCEFLVSWTGQSQLVDGVTLELVEYTGATVAGGTTTGGIHYAIGSIPTVTGGTFVAFLGFNTGAVGVASATTFNGTTTANGFVQLTPGTTYQFKALIAGQQTGRNYSNMYLNVGMREVA